jgi:hypothetical protein
MAHHAIKKPSSATLAAVVADFRNEIGTKRTFPSSSGTSALRGIADLADPLASGKMLATACSHSERLWNGRFWGAKRPLATVANSQNMATFKGRHGG